MFPVDVRDAFVGIEAGFVGGEEVVDEAVDEGSFVVRLGGVGEDVGVAAFWGG